MTQSVSSMCDAMTPITDILNAQTDMMINQATDIFREIAENTAMKPITDILNAQTDMLTKSVSTMCDAINPFSDMLINPDTDIQKLQADIIEPVTNIIKTEPYTKSSTANKEDISIPFDTKHSSIIMSMLEAEDFESGVINPSERYFAEILKLNKECALNCLSKIFMDNFSMDGRKVNNLVGILHIVSHFDYKQVYPIGQMLAIAAISHKNNGVCEFGIKCFENWENTDGIEKLQAIQFSTKWLKDYADAVIEDLSGGV